MRSIPISNGSCEKLFCSLTSQETYTAKMYLQELCIGVIADDFQRYSAFSKSDDANLKRKLEFLLRVYSYQIVRHLVSRNNLFLHRPNLWAFGQMMSPDTLPAEYIDLLVNKYLKTLDTRWLRDCPWETVVAKFAEVGSNFREVYFHDKPRSKFDSGWDPTQQLLLGTSSMYILPWKNVIHHLTSLEVLSFRYYCTDEILKMVSRSCPNIVEIDIFGSFVTDEGIKYLCIKENGKPLCPKLKKVLTKHSRVKDEGVKCLIRNVRSLELTDCDNLPEVLYSMHQNDLSSLNKIEPYNLTTLNLLPMHDVLHYTDLLKLCLSVCPFLKSLSCPVSNEEHLALLSSLLKLEELHLECFSNAEIDVTDLIRRKGQKLTSLTVTLCSLSVAALSESCPSLKQLSLNQVAFKSVDNITASFKCLETCIFNFNRYDPATVQSVSLLLKYSPKLESLGFKSCDLSSSELRNLRNEILKCCECCPIKDVSFTRTVLHMDFINCIYRVCARPVAITSSENRFL